MKMKFRGLSPLKIVLVLWAAGLFFPVLPAASEEVVDRIVAVVNEDIIRLTELEAEFKPVAELIRSKGLPPEKEEETLYETRMQILDEKINETLADQKIEEAGIKVDDHEVEATIERVKQMNYYTDEDLRRALQMRGMTMERYRQEIRRQVLRSKLVNYKVKSSIVVTESDIRKYYDAHPEAYGGTKQYTLRNIFMAYPEPGESSDREQVRGQLEDIRKQLDNDAVSFPEMAERHSQAPNAGDGGELGRFAISDLSAQLQSVISGLKAGQFSNVIETDQGFQVFYVEEISETPAQPLEEIRSEIEKKLYDAAVDQKFNSWIESLRKNAHIKIIR